MLGIIVSLIAPTFLLECLSIDNHNPAHCIAYVEDFEWQLNGNSKQYKFELMAIKSYFSRKSYKSKSSNRLGLVIYPYKWILS